MAQFMQQNTAEYQAYERKNTLGIGGMVWGGFGEPNERNEKQKGQMDAQFYAKDPSHAYGPASHRLTSPYFI